MTTLNSKLTAAIALLSDRSSAKRRSAAKQIRKLQNPAAGPALLSALQKEILDSRTWETQYQMIMALGECQYIPALPYIKILSHQVFDATMVYIAIGDAIVRLERTHQHDAMPVLQLLSSNNHMVIEGAMRATAMLRLVPKQEEVDQIIDDVTHNPVPWGITFWVAAAAPGWHGSKVDSFLANAATSHIDDLRRAAVAAQQKKYLMWRPL